MGIFKITFLELKTSQYVQAINEGLAFKIALENSDLNVELTKKASCKIDLVSDIDFFDFKRIIQLTNRDLKVSEHKYKIQTSILSNSKLIEKMLELMEELEKSGSERNQKMIIEENYDVLNTAVSTYISFFGEKQFRQHFANLKDIDEVNSLRNMIKDTRLLNSLIHIDTVFQSKMGLKSEMEFSKQLMIIVKKSIYSIKNDCESNELSHTVEMITKKLDKWEGKA